MIAATLAMAAISAAAATAQSVSQPQTSEPPWPAFSVNEKGGGPIAPAKCGPLAYFRRSPLPFDFGSDMWGWQPGSYRFGVSDLALGSVAGHRIEQIDFRVAPTGTSTSVRDGTIKLLIVQRHANRYCLLFQEQDFYHTFLAIGPARILTVAGEQVLNSRDPESGSGHFVADWSWTFQGGVPIVLDVASAIGPALKHLVPAGCGNRKGDPFSLPGLTYSAQLWKPTDSEAGPSCGSILIQLAFQAHKLVVRSAKYSPPGRPH